MNLNFIKTLTIRSKEEGAAQTTAALKGVESAYKGVAEVSEKSAKGQLSLADGVAKAERRFNSSIRASQDFEKVQRQMNMAVAQNPALQERVNKVLADARVHFDQVSRGQRTFAAATQAANDNLRGFAGQAGIAGTALLALGPWGIAAAVAIAVATLALKGLAHEAGRFADEMGKLRDTAQIIDITATQLQALNDKGAEFALTPDKIATGLQRFTAQLEEARRGEGELFTQMQRLDPAMALQFARTRDTASALEIYAGALNKASAAERVALSRAGLGRGGFDVGLMLAGAAKSGGLNQLTEEFKKSGDAIDTEIIEKVRKLKREIDDMAADARNNLASVFSVQTLEAERKFTEDWLEFSRSVKNFNISGDLRYLLETVLKIKLGGPGTLLGWMGIDYSAGYKAPPPAQRPDTFAERFQPATDNPLKPFSTSDADRNRKVLDLNLYKQEIAILGEVATAGERYKLRQLEINAAVAQHPSLQQAANRALAAASAAFKLDAMRANIVALGESATLTEQYTLRVANLQHELDRGVISQQTFNRAVAGQKEALELSLGVADMAAATAQRLAQVREVAAKAGLTDEQTRLAVALAQREAKERELQAWARLNPQLAAAKDAASDFTQSLLTGLLEGKNGFDVLIAAAGQFGQALMSIGTKDIAKGLTGGVKGLLDGKGMGGFSFDPASLAMAAMGSIISLWAGNEQKKKQEAEAQARAWEQWQAAGLQLASYFAKANGTSVGNIRTQLQEQQTEAERFIKLRSESQGFKNRAQEDADPIIREIRAAYGRYFRRLQQEFETNFAPTIEAMKSGFGEDSPIFQAFQNVKSVGEKLQAFIADAEFIFGKGSGQAGEARGAAQTRALSLLQGGGDQLSEVQKRFQEIQGTARGLQKVLEDLGMSSEEARRQIEAGVVRAIETLKNAFTEDLQREINDLQGKGFLNDFFDLFKKNDERLKDNAALGGGNEDLIAKLFGLSAQGIVDRFKLTGESFQELIRKFPELSGVVTAFSDLVTEAAKRSKEDIDSARLSIQDELFALTNDTSTVAGQLAALEREFNRRRAEETKAGGELSIDLQELYEARRFQIIEDANAKALEEAQRAAEEQARAINQAARGVLETIQGWQAGPSSTLSPQDILTNAQAFYSSNLTLAQGNPADQATIDAVNKWPQLADNVEKALRAVYGSATQYQTGKSQLIAEGIALSTVQAADDPLVVALRDTVTAVNLLSGQTVVTNTGLINVGTNLGTVSGRLTTLANDLGGPGGVSERMVALGKDLGGTGGVSQRLIDLAGTVGTGNDAALRAKMIALAAEVNTAAGKATTLGTEVKAAADKATELATVIGTNSTGVIKALIDFGANLSSIANAVLASFKAIDTNADNLINYTEFHVAAGGSTQEVLDTFNALDINNDSQLSQLELMVGAQQEANKLLDSIGELIRTLNKYIGEDGTGNVRGISLSIKAALDGNAIILTAVNEIAGTNNYLLDLMYGQDLQLVALNQTAAAQLTLLNNNLTGGAVAPPPGSPGGVATGGGATVGSSHQYNAPNFSTGADNNLLLALNKIVFNTAAIANNTSYFGNDSGAPVGPQANGWQGRLAAGGWIGGNLHSQGGTMINAELGEHVTNRISAGYNRSLLDAINAARGPLDLASLSGMNDNFRIAPNVVPLPVSAGRSDAGFNFARMLSVMEAQGRQIVELTEEVKDLKRVNQQGNRIAVAGFEQLSDDINENTGETSEQTREMKNANSGKWAA